MQLNDGPWDAPLARPFLLGRETPGALHAEGGRNEEAETMEDGLGQVGSKRGVQLEGGKPTISKQDGHTWLASHRQMN